MNNLTNVPVKDGKVSCERCGAPVLRDKQSGTYQGCSDHFIRMDVDGGYAVFSNYEEERD